VLVVINIECREQHTMRKEHVRRKPKLLVAIIPTLVCELGRRAKSNLRPLFLKRVDMLRIIALLALFISPVFAQEHHAGHPAADIPIHEKFYSTWFMPDQPTKSCCNQADCYPTQVKFEDGHWSAQRREDGKFIPIPWQKVEQNRDNPDGRSHVCMPPATATYYPPNTIFCFTLGGGA
jgi:hypothetical protein